MNEFRHNSIAVDLSKYYSAEYVFELIDRCDVYVLSTNIVVNKRFANSYFPEHDMSIFDYAVSTGNLLIVTFLIKYDIEIENRCHHVERSLQFCRRYVTYERIKSEINNFISGNRDFSLNIDLLSDAIEKFGYKLKDPELSRIIYSAIKKYLDRYSESNNLDDLKKCQLCMSWLSSHKSLINNELYFSIYNE